MLLCVEYNVSVGSQRALIYWLAIHNSLMCENGMYTCARPFSRLHLALNKIKITIEFIYQSQNAPTPTVSCLTKILSRSQKPKSYMLNSESSKAAANVYLLNERSSALIKSVNLTALRPRFFSTVVHSEILCSILPGCPFCVFCCSCWLSNDKCTHLFLALPSRCERR